MDSGIIPPRIRSLLQVIGSLFQSADIIKLGFAFDGDMDKLRQSYPGFRCFEVPFSLHMLAQHFLFSRVEELFFEERRLLYAYRHVALLHGWGANRPHWVLTFAPT
jgi:hypothetical protein